ncbi:MAG: YlxR family protein [Microbacteriaceae bacterium]|nr:YlxR family protein [Cryobacterium sp.]MCC6375951.1 YlxR family protein [Microbacteriaceae bacterium]
MDSVRTCLGCRQRVGQSSLLRVVAVANKVEVDQTATMPGRGAWVHPAESCVQNAIARKAFARALRVDGSLQTEAVLSHIKAAKATSKEQAERAMGK